jgi:hypothetical protein
MPEQIADLFERRPLREVMDVVSAVRENAPLPVEIADLGRSHDDIF